MAPALPLAPRDEPEALLSHRRRALVSVDNRSLPMDEDDMGLPNQPSLAKDSQEMEQILVDLGEGEIGHPDLLQALKTLETAGDALSTGDPADAIFQFSGLDLADGVDSEGDQVEEKIKLTQARLERRCAFLHRRLRILQLRSIGKRISEEVVQTFEKCTRGARKDGGGRPMGLKAFLKRVETTAALQASAASRSSVGPKHYHAGPSRGDASRTASVGISTGALTGLQDTAGALQKHLTVVKRQLDSDATLSSSGAESNDETVTYNNQHQEHMPIAARALWRWQRARASIASRWCWLQAQVQELEYKIRQHTDLHRQVREAKGPVEFEGEPVGYEGSLPGAEIPEIDENDPATETCARVRPLRRETFKKRKLLQMHNLHIATQKAAKPSDIDCRCQLGVESCPVCTGRAAGAGAGAGAGPGGALTPLPPPHARALLDPGYHPVLSDLHDVSPAVHMSLLSSRSWFHARAHKAFRGAHHASAPRAAHAHAHAHAHAPHNSAPAAPATPTTPRSKRHPTRLKRGRPPLSRKIKDREQEETSGHDRSRGRSSTETRYRRQSYDIDNIVIPQSVAANTRPQILTYKEIITPKWRVLELPETPLNNGVSKTAIRLSVESEEEDVSEQAVAARHTRAERSERTRFAKNRRELLREQQREQRRQLQRDLELQQAQLQHTQPPHTQAQHTPPPHTPPPHTQPPHTQPQHTQPQHTQPQHTQPQHTQPPHTQQLQRPHQPREPSREMDADLPETVRPYTPRQFPLPDEIYQDMVAAMPDGYHRHSPPPSPPAEDELDRSSTMSPLSPTPYDGDDPDDQEWDPSSEKAERRKSAFR